MSQSTERIPVEVSGRLPKRIVIVGNTESAWMAAAVLARWSNRLNCRITVVSDGAPTEEFIGEATQPSIRGLLANLGIEEHEMMRRCHATYHLATQFSDWVQQDRDFWVPLTAHDTRLESTTAFHGWLAERGKGRLLRPFHSYALHWGAALAGKAPYGFSADSPISTDGTFAFQLDGQKFAGYLRSAAIDSGVQEINGNTESVAPNGRGGIAQVRLTTGNAVPGDLFIDCTGHESVLMSAVLSDSAAASLTHELCDRAIRVRLPGRRQVPPFSRIAGHSSGWTWQSAFSSGIEIGLAFSSHNTDDDMAWSELRDIVRASGFGDPASGEDQPDDSTTSDHGGPQCASLQAHRKSRFWQGNVIALGTAAGRVDPVISAGRHMTQMGIELLIESFPERSPSDASIDHYNKRMRHAADELSDFAQLHYLLSRRADSEFWRTATETHPSPGLQQRLALYNASGFLDATVSEAFGEARYQHLLAGCGRLPEQPSLRAQTADPSAIQDALRAILKQNETALKDLPLHEELLDWIHSAQPGFQQSA
jgi:tryptophan 7-halogenase